MRKFVFRSALRPALIAGLLCVMSEPEHSIAQVGRAKSVARQFLNNSAPAPAPAPTPSLAPAPVPATAATANQPGTTELGAAAKSQPVDPFQQMLDRAIEVTSKRYLTATGSNPHSPWQIFHCILALRNETLLKSGSEKINAIQWLSTTEPKFAGEPWLMLTPHGAKFHPYTQKYYFEGHPGQFLALLSHSNLPLDHKFHVQGKVVTLNDLLNNTMKEVNTKEEVTWVLWTLQHYLKSDAVWLNKDNETWSIERLVQMESDAPVVGAPCGGNHRLFALTRARDKYLQNGGKLRGAWLQADRKIRQHIELARSLQNEDGSFSSESYKGKMHTNDVNNRFNTTGHTMEFLSISLPQERLNETWVRNAVWTLSRELVAHQNTMIDCGPLFHSLDALILYRDRIRPKAPVVESPSEPPQIANPKSDIPLSASPSILTPPVAVAQPSLVVPKTATALSEETKANLPQATSIPVPPTDTARLENSVSESKPEFTRPAPPPSHATSVVARPASSKNPQFKIDANRFRDVGNPAPPQKVLDRKPMTGRSGNRDQFPLAAPALLPDTIATPLQISASAVEKAQADCGESSPVTRKSAWVPSAESSKRDPLPLDEIPHPLRDLVPIDQLESIEFDDSASALEPANG
ncbi:hypothetical protein [Schlesneria paludicola]|uniref:hypothetical protein n=1 Tax=Schlesneria paludicola TaxID=360056 RepID=UPI00029A46BD|nr:hypothetical protein [Schlesneria paludicola]